VFDNRVLMRKFGPKRNEVAGGRRKFHKDELRGLYSSTTIIRVIKSRKMGWAGHVARMGEKRNAYRLLVEKTEGKGPLGRPRRKWVFNIKMDVAEMGLDWCKSGQMQLESSCERGNEPSGSFLALLANAVKATYLAHSSTRIYFAACVGC
jgi:hypothetical protein